MAFTATKLKESVFGDVRVWMGTVSADNTSGAVSFGMSTLYNAHATPKSSSTQANNIRLNALPEGTAAAGTLAFSGCLATAEFYVTVFGR